MRSAYAINTLQYDASLCTGCRMCSLVCPHGVFGMNEKRARLLHTERCMECGACQKNCQPRAITVDSGVGCAAAMISAALRGKKEATCGGEDDSSCCCT